MVRLIASYRLDFERTGRTQQTKLNTGFLFIDHFLAAVLYD